MKHTSGPRNTANLSESMHQRLNMYALAAGAAGVSVLALSPSGEAKIVYTPADKNITPDHTISLDLNRDGKIDFRLKGYAFHESHLWVRSHRDSVGSTCSSGQQNMGTLQD